MPADRHDAFLVAFSGDPNRGFGQVDVVAVEIDELRQSQSG